MLTQVVFPKAGVAGWPIAHSRSPVIHGFWLKTLGIAGAYERFEVRPGEFDKFARLIGHDGLVGVNVTAPHKGSAFAACDRHTAVAAALKAVNTLWRKDGLLWGDNTDVEGFLANMDATVPGWSSGSDSAIVIGAGGAARAVVYALASRGFRRIAIVNRTHAKAVALAGEFSDVAVAAPWETLSAELPRGNLLVNASSLGMIGQPPLEIEVDALRRGSVVSDIVYVPLRTSMVKSARARGLQEVEGLGMLLHQAVPAFERWFGRRPEVTPALRSLIEADILAADEERR
ncbi:MAG TPA: shikimate dehydrogenase [Roseiarcus sp.]|jgi:shikimate dehydrogenase|nr:shikimate dehydrogenase [Roseiarcus sp.]